MNEKFPDFNLFSLSRFIYALGFGALVITGGGGKTQQVVEDYHPTKQPKKIELGDGISAEFTVEKHDGYQAVGQVTLVETEKTNVVQDFALQKGQSLPLAGGVQLLHEHRKK